MAGTRFCGVLFFAGCVIVSAFAQEGGKTPKIARVIDEDALIHVSPSWKSEKTGKLKRGEQVIVHHEEHEMYAIEPPAGSINWINHRFLGGPQFNRESPEKQNAVVVIDAEMRIGTVLNNEVLTRKVVKVPAGTIVETLGTKQRLKVDGEENGSFWYPVKPPEGDYRYVAKSNLSKLELMPSPPATATVRNNNNNSNSGNRTNSVATAPNGTTDDSLPRTVNDPLWDRAEQAESDSRFSEAAKLYTELYQQLKKNNSDLDLQLACLNRIDACLANAKRSGRPLVLDPNQSKTPSNRGGNGAPATLQVPRNNGAPPRSDYSTSRSTDPYPTPSVTPSPVIDERNLESSGPGKLRKASFFIDNQQAYALDDADGRVICYVTAPSSVRLEDYVNRKVELFGKKELRGDIRAGYMKIAKVTPLK